MLGVECTHSLHHGHMVLPILSILTPPNPGETWALQGPLPRVQNICNNNYIALRLQTHSLVSIHLDVYNVVLITHASD